MSIPAHMFIRGMNLNNLMDIVDAISMSQEMVVGERMLLKRVCSMMKKRIMKRIPEPTQEEIEIYKNNHVDGIIKYKTRVGSEFSLTDVKEKIEVMSK